MGNCRLVTLTSIPRKVMKQKILETISRYKKEQVVQWTCGISITGDTQNSSGHCFGQPVLADPL